MSKHAQGDTGILSQWYWIWLVSGFFVTVMTVFFFVDYPGWFHYVYRGISLSHEMSYAVWWSGICLFIAGIIFATVGHLATLHGKKSWAWYVLALAMVALCFDEIGSLHESVARIGGWLGLLPFALVFAIAFGLALLHLIRQRDTRLVAFLIAVGLGIFVAVAGLEFLEHDASFQHVFWRRARLVGEEAIELVAMGILISAGLIAFKGMGDGNRRFLNVTSVVSRLLDMPFILFSLLVVQLLLTAAFVVPNYTAFPEGNPSALFPILLFFCLGIIAMQYSRKQQARKFWVFQAWLLVAASLLQMYNMVTLLTNLVGVDTRLFTGPPLSWMVTMLPLGTLMLLAIQKGRLSIRRAATLLLPLLLIYILVYPDLEFRYRIDFLYFLFSAAVAYSCYVLMRLLRPAEHGV